MRRLYRQAQSESGQDHREGIEPRITSLGERPIQRLAGKPSLVSECGHAADGIDHRAQCNRHRTRVTILQHCLNVCGDLGLAS